MPLNDGFGTKCASLFRWGRYLKGRNLSRPSDLTVASSRLACFARISPLILPIERMPLNLWSISKRTHKYSVPLSLTLIACCTLGEGRCASAQKSLGPVELAQGRLARFALARFRIAPRVSAQIRIAHTRIHTR